MYARWEFYWLCKARIQSNSQVAFRKIDDFDRESKSSYEEIEDFDCGCKSLNAEKVESKDYLRYEM